MRQHWQGGLFSARRSALDFRGDRPQKFLARESLRLVTVSQNALFSLRSTLYPEDEKGEDGYPDNQNLPLVNLPGEVKASKWRNKK